MYLLYVFLLLIPLPLAEPFSTQLRHSPSLASGNRPRYEHHVWPVARRRRPSYVALASSSAAPNGSDNVFSMDYYNPNQIEPQTKSLPKSITFFAHFVVQRIHENRRKRQLLQSRARRRKGAAPVNGELVHVTGAPDLQLQTKHVPAWRNRLRKLEEQRQNLVKLANYSASIVAPSFLFLMLGALMTSIVPLYYSQCIHLVSTLDGNVRHLWRALSGLCLVTIAASFLTGARGSLFWIAGSRANYNIRVKLHRGLLLQEAAFFDGNETGYLLSRLNNDVNKIGQVISYHINVVCRQLAQFLFGSAYLLRISPKLSMGAFAGIAVVAWVSAVYGDFNRALAQRVQDTLADATAVAETSFSMSETIRAFDGVETESQKYQAAQSRALDLEEVQAWGYGTHKFVSDSVQAVLQVLLLLACWTVGRAGGLPASELTTFLFYTNFVLESSNEVGDQWAKIQGAVGASSSVFDLICRIPKVRDPPALLQQRDVVDIGASLVDGAVSDEPVNGETAPSAALMTTRTNGDARPIIELVDTTVTYGTMEVPALNHVDLAVYEGDKVAIVGRSGSGKSTLLRSILRFYDPLSGCIRLEGTALTDMTRQELASKVAVVEQEPSLFPMSLLDNVLYGIEKDTTDLKTGKPIYSTSYREAAAKSLRLAGLAVHPGNDLNLELDTRVGEGGRSLSGGQRQRVAIARALIRHPRVLLLDEPTAALDSQSEKAVIGALRTAMEYAKSMVMVTHRLGVVRALGVNRVVVMEKGEIAESGHPEDLLRKKGGIYASLAREQGITAVAPYPSELPYFAEATE